MKAKDKVYLITLAAVLSLNAATAQPFDSVGDLSNRAIAASPRARELFPWLTRSGEPVKASKATSIADKNRAFAASPRVLEEYPELARPSQAAKSGGEFATPVIKNRAVASSPRVKEEFPWLARGNYKLQEEPFQIAPLK